MKCARFGMHERWLKSLLYSIWKHGTQTHVVMICTMLNTCHILNWH